MTRLSSRWPSHVLREPRSAYQAHLASVEGAKIDGFGNIAVRLSPRLAYFKDFERGQLESAALENFGDPFQQLTALFERSATPFLKRRARCRHGAFRFGNVGFGGIADDLIWLARIDRGKHLISPNLLAVDCEWNFASKLFALFSQCRPHFFLVLGQCEVR